MRKSLLKDNQFKNNFSLRIRIFKVFKVNEQSIGRLVQKRLGTAVLKSSLKPPVSTDVWINAVGPSSLTPEISVWVSCVKRRGSCSFAK